MPDLVKTSEMKLGPSRVPVMMKKQVANRLASYILSRGSADYDEVMERVIEAGLAATVDGEKSR